MQNAKAPLDDFKFTTAKMSHSGSLFDINKLDDVSKNAISVMSADEVTAQVIDWAKQFDHELYTLLSADYDYAKSIFAIGRTDAKPRKDLAKWNEVRDYAGLFFDPLFKVEDAYPENVSAEDKAAILSQFMDGYDQNDDSQAWFDKLKAIAVGLGYAEKPKDFKKNPEMYKGHVGDISMVLRIAVSGKSKSPDLYSIMQIIGKDRTFARIKAAMEEI